MIINAINKVTIPAQTFALYNVKSGSQDCDCGLFRTTTAWKAVAASSGAKSKSAPFRLPCQSAQCKEATPQYRLLPVGVFQGVSPWMTFCLFFFREKEDLGRKRTKIEALFNSGGRYRPRNLTNAPHSRPAGQTNGTNKSKKLWSTYRSHNQY